LVDPIIHCSLATVEAIRLKVVEASPDAKIVIDRHGVIVDLNEEAEFLFGYARSDLFGRPIEILLPEEVRERHKGHIASFFQAPRRRDMGVGLTLNGLHRDKVEFPVKIRLAPIVIEGAEGGIFGLAVVRRAE